MPKTRLFEVTINMADKFGVGRDMDLQLEFSNDHKLPKKLDPRDLP
jgi:hypothetical protein